MTSTSINPINQSYLILSYPILTLIAPCKDTLLARPVAIKALRERSEREGRESAPGESDQQQEYFRSIKDYKLKAGETVPGASGSALRRAQADLGWVPGRKVRWFERRKLGIDRPLSWEQV